MIEWLKDNYWKIKRLRLKLILRDWMIVRLKDWKTETLNDLKIEINIKRLM